MYLLVVSLLVSSSETDCNLNSILKGVLIAFSMVLSSYSITISLLLCFLGTSKATKFRQQIKSSFECNFKEDGQRNWIQIICNLGVANFATLLRLLMFGAGEYAIDFEGQFWNSCLLLAALTAISCALGDTLSSELGSVMADEPLLITTLKPVPIGTNGAISIAGLVAACAGGLLIGFGSLASFSLFTDHSSSPQWPIVLFCLYGSLFGSVIDSILGATLQYSGYDHWRKRVVEVPPTLTNSNCHTEHISGRDVFDNHTVNLLATLIISLLNPIVAAYFWPVAIDHPL